MTLSAPRRPASVRPLAPAVLVAGLSVLVSGFLPAGPADLPPAAAADAATSLAPLVGTAPATATAGDSAPRAASEVTGETAREIAVGGVDPLALDAAAVAGLDADGRARLAVLGAPVTGRSFTVIAAAWDAGAGDGVESVQVRVRQDGSWSGWQDLEKSVLNAPVGATREGTDPMIAFGADGAQVRVVTEDGTAPAGFRLTLIDPGTAATDAAVAAPDTSSSASTDPDGDDALPTAVRAAALRQNTPADAPAPVAALTATSARTAADARRRILPDVITRAQWGADESWASSSVQFEQVKALTIHHSAGSNSYSRAQAVEQMRGIYALYTKVLRWGDFPYHLITDRFGNIYEGRRGALDSNPLGTHAGGFNTGTLGISTLGNYDVVAPSQAVVDAMARATAYYVYREGLDAHGKVTLTSRKSTRYAAGTRVTVDTIFPHRSVSLTACPGRYLTPRLDEIRDKAATIAARAAGGAVPAVPAPAPAPPTRTAPATGTGTTTTYTVRPNDGWWLVAERTGVSQATLQRLNAMTPRTLLHPGMVLTLGDAAAASAAPAVTPAPRSAVTYTVRPNDGWWLVAERTGVSQRTLQRLNGMSSRTLLHPGMVLQIR